MYVKNNEENVLTPEFLVKFVNVILLPTYFYNYIVIWTILECTYFKPI